jgi:hypothetical protein
MAIRFRKSMKIMPGVRVSLSKSGVSGSLGTNGARVSVNSKGQVRGTAGISGTGLSSTTMLNSKSKSKATKSDEDTTNEIVPIVTSKEDVPNISLFMVVIPWILLGAFVHEWLGFAWLALMIPVWLFNKFLRFAAEYPSLIPGMQEELDVIAKERAA